MSRNLFGYDFYTELRQHEERQSQDEFRKAMFIWAFRRNLGVVVGLWEKAADSITPVFITRLYDLLRPGRSLQFVLSIFDAESVHGFIDLYVRCRDETFAELRPVFPMLPRSVDEGLPPEDGPLVAALDALAPERFAR